MEKSIADVPTRQPNRARRRELQRTRLTRKQRAQSRARTDKRIGWRQPSKEAKCALPV